jgi:hypothetical protein
MDLIFLHEAGAFSRAGGLEDLKIMSQKIINRVANIRLVVHHK